MLKALTQVEAEKAEIMKEELEMAKDRVNVLKKMKETGGQAAEVIYDNLRD